MSYSARPVSETRRFVKEETPIRTPEDVFERLKTRIDRYQEHFFVVTLDTGKKPIKVHDVFKGTLNAATCHPRDIFREAIKDNAAAIIIAHNHPSGSLVPSLEDLKVTQNIFEASRILGIDFLDHLIITAKNGFYSFAGNGHLNH